MGPCSPGRRAPHLQRARLLLRVSTKHLFSWTTPAGATIGFSTLAFLMLLIAALTWLLLRFTMLGKGIYALGGNRRPPSGPVSTSVGSSSSSTASSACFPASPRSSTSAWCATCIRSTSWACSWT